MLQRVRDLKVQYANGTLDDDDKTRSPPRSSSSARRSRTSARKTEFNGIKLLDGGRDVTFQVGANDGETITLPPSTSALSAPPAPAACRDHRHRLGRHGRRR